jgi:hypothetical protein
MPLCSKRHHAAPKAGLQVENRKNSVPPSSESLRNKKKKMSCVATREWMNCGRGCSTRQIPVGKRQSGSGCLRRRSWLRCLGRRGCCFCLQEYVHVIKHSVQLGQPCRYNHSQNNPFRGMIPRRAATKRDDQAAEDRMATRLELMGRQTLSSVFHETVSKRLLLFCRASQQRAENKGPPGQPGRS